MKKWFAGMILAVVIGGLGGGFADAAEMNLIDDRFAIEWPVLVTVVRPSDGGGAFMVVKNNQVDKMLGFDQFEVYRVKEGVDRGLAGWGLAADKKDFLISVEGEVLLPGEERKFSVASGLLPISGSGEVYIQIGWRHPTLGGERKAWFRYDECLTEADGEEGSMCELTADNKGGLKYIWMKEEKCGSWVGAREQEGYGAWEDGYGPSAEGDACGGSESEGDSLKGISESVGDVVQEERLPKVPSTGAVDGDGSWMTEQWVAGTIVIVGAAVVVWYFFAYRRRDERVNSV